MRLTSLAQVSRDARLPRYTPSAHGVGIIHIGLGAFHKAHQAIYTDAALAEDGGDWRIVGVSLRSSEAAEALNAQNGFYTLLERGPDGTTARVIGSIRRAIAEARTPGATLAALCDPAIRIVTLTVTEKAYGIDRVSGGVAAAHPAIAADLASPQSPSGVIGLIVEALRLRREADIAPFDILCCDNLPHNGHFLRGGCVDLARRLDPGLADWIDGEVAFPSSMVDRITPAPTAVTLDDAARLTGCEDRAAVETEPFTQWVIEDRFTGHRPLWEAAGALIVSDVPPYERMKLRMLNGAHSMLAYAGFLSGCRYVRDAMALPELATLVRRHLAAAAATLEPLPGVDFAVYANELEARFANPAIAHETYQIAMDGTEKLPQRILEPAEEALTKSGNAVIFAFAVACWMRYCHGMRESGEAYSLRDPRESAIAAALEKARGAEEVSAALHALPGVFPPFLRENRLWRSGVATALADIMETGIASAIARAAKTG